MTDRDSSAEATPLTDAAICRYTGGEPVTFPAGIAPVVPADFARSLERALGRANRELASASADRRDAERYRWLRDDCADYDAIVRWLDLPSPEASDAAIDAAKGGERG